MSRGFVKEGDQEDVPLVTARAFLPPGVENFVTAEGLQALKDERESLVDERRQFEGADTPDARVNSNYITAKIKQVDERIRTARLTPFDPEKQHEVAFGATVRFKNLKNGVEATYRIVGVENEVTLREGQTMESYCVRTLGGIAMLPYCQVLNDTTELGAGATMKIPKLELKSKSK